MKRLFLLISFFPVFTFGAGEYQSDISDIRSSLLFISRDLESVLTLNGNFHNDFNFKLSSVLSSLNSINSNIAAIDIPNYSSILNSINSNIAGIEIPDHDYSSFLNSINSTLSNLNLDKLATEYTLSSIDSKLVPVYSYYSDSSKPYVDSVWAPSRVLLEDVLNSLTENFSVPESSKPFVYYVAAKNGLNGTPTSFSVPVVEHYGFFNSSLRYDYLQFAALSSLNNSYVYFTRNFNTDLYLDYNDSHSYASIDFESNSVPEEVQLDYSKMNFFQASLKLLSDGNKINGATTMFLKHIRERLPDLKTKDTKADEDRIEQSISDTSQQVDSLKQSFEFSEISFKDSAEFFDGDSILNELKNSYCPSAITLRIPEFMGMPEYVVSVLVSDIQPFLDVSRAVFGCVYFVLIAGFVWFVFRLFVPVLSRFSKLLATVLNW